MKRTVLVAATAALAVVAGCSSSGGSTSTTATTTSAPATATDSPTTLAPTSSPGSTSTRSATATPTATRSPIAGASTSTVTRAPRGSGTALLRAVRLAGQPGYDRFVLEFTGPVPGYVVGYVKAPIRRDPSDQVVTIPGKAFLRIRTSPASGYDLTSPTGARTYTGRLTITADTAAVTRAVETGDFEGVLTWVLGVDAKRPFRVLTLTGPSRIVVDVATG